MKIPTCLCVVLGKPQQLQHSEVAEEQEACFRQTGTELKFRMMQAFIKETS